MTVRELAKIENVSPSTVSLVLNRKPGVKQATRDAVAKLLLENGYELKNPEKENETAASGESPLLLMKFSGGKKMIETTDDFFAKILEGIESEAQKNDCTLSIVTVTSDSLRQEALDAQKTYAGIVVFATEMNAGDLHALKDIRIPIVLVDCTFPTESFSTVSPSNYGGMYSAIQYLKQTQHRQIGYLHSTLKSGSIPARAQAYFNIIGPDAFEPDFIYNVNPFLDEAEETLYALFQSRKPFPDAFVSDNDVIAIAATRALNRLGYSVPDDISIIGFDGSYLAVLNTPPLTTVQIDKTALGRTAVKVVLDLLQEPNPRPVYKVEVGTNLIIRQSVRKG